MADYRGPVSRPSRAPLGDATARINNTSSTHSTKSTQAQVPQPNPLRAHPTNLVRQHSSSDPSATSKHDNSRAPPPKTNSRAPVIPQNATDNKRNSQASTTTVTTSGGERRKTHIGPWKLGKTLGNGSAARVRLVRHNVTNQLAAVKILSRNGNSMMQPGSIAALDRWDRTRAEYKSENRIPFVIEREVAIMKLIDHPNIVKLYDIWENRSEIYLVLEYVEQGDLYSYLARSGPLAEDETMYFFRQILDALEYVHSFNICHRDLKPENILLTKDYRIKITDFGMSAMHQGPNHLLKTACGSPHYAAPELMNRSYYRGDKTDIWSLGVILYACMCNVLPFEDDNVHLLLAKIKRGQYHMPSFIGREARDLIGRLLTLNPDERISIREIWQHPLLRRYDYLDKLNNGDRAHGYTRDARYDPVPADELDMQTLRQLKSVWHTFDEKQLASKLVSPERNEFKTFYWLLYSYREKRLENYGTELTYSASDYHHLQPPNWKKKYTTLDFPSKNGRSMSRFTVISNIATDENGEPLERASIDCGATIQSYDPYKSSRVLDDVVASQAKIVIHRNGTTSTRNSQAPSIRSRSGRTNSTYSRRGTGGKHMKAPHTLRGSRRSLNSIQSGEEISYKRSASRRKRGVNFSRAHRQLASQSEAECSPTNVTVHSTTYGQIPSTPTSSSKRKKRLSKNREGIRSVAHLSEMAQAKDDGLCWNEELRQFSNTIAKDCDDAFNSTLLSQESYLGESPFSESKTILTSTSTPAPATQGAGEMRVNAQSRESWPLPTASKDLDVHRYATAKRTDQVRGSILEPVGQGKMVSQRNRPDQSGRPFEQTGAERRIVSAPIYSQYSTQWGKDKIPLPAINEGAKEDDSFEDGDRLRVVSAPAESSPARHVLAEEGAGLEHLAQIVDTIRLVDSPSNRRRKITVPAAADNRKEISQGVKEITQARQGLTLRQQYVEDGIRVPSSNEPSDEPAMATMPARTDSTATIKKKSSWFKRSSKEKFESSDGSSLGNIDALNHTETNSSTNPAAQPAKKRSFPFAFWRGNKEQPQFKVSLAGPEVNDSSNPEPPRASSRSSHRLQTKKSQEKPGGRNIEPQQNWLARLFRVKPATRYICFSIPRRHVRQEIVILLKGWRRHGMRDIVVDKERNLVFARVGNKNDLEMKETSFAAEIMTVIEHGRRNQLCIVRFTQERGAASTFNKVVDTMDDIFLARGLLIVDKYKTKMMIKTLNS
ncbi:Pkinase-domain-containing protein [Daldinia decipiens]|uniref:Pkinase-domain-containing protein n=1 Tax=Daldinia decipiens TaxID=326647 RepID=UPI0020C1EB19|nr:Pkinase-domain-containing protein [Daldinia decipiens]KAI1658784.1 Pkinase-domain-containing protein [Daldinia decipiens]